ncbi:uncharacterized protein METZ01_LOCUS238017 [marine metagenome]|uniref:Uncharacterized protein n=1 Tax=marine metagenome TaxID=408172 RepID=A0A382HEK2_9ZZZZ
MILDEKTILERKDALLRDLNTVQQRSVEIEKKKLEDIALANALTGAIQQCDAFLKMLNDEESDVENSSEED